MTLRLFISSVQREFAPERAALRDYLRGDALLRRFFEDQDYRGSHRES
jgi:ATP-dependent DNA helicase RecG